MFGFLLLLVLLGAGEVVQIVHGCDVIPCPRAVKEYDDNTFNVTEVFRRKVAGKAQLRQNVSIFSSAPHWHAVATTSLLKPTPPSFPNCNVVYVKAKKVGGTTVSGILRHTAHHHHLRGYEDVGAFKHNTTKEPVIWADHADYAELRDLMSKRMKLPAMVVSWVRDPVSRCMSAYYYNYVSYHHHHESAHTKTEFMGKFCHNEQYTILAPSESVVRSEGLQSLPILDQLMAQYHFIGVAERFDESVVAMKNVLNLTLADVLHANSKVAGTRGLAPHKTWANETEMVRAAGDGDAFYAANQLDFLLHVHANRVLDAVIAGIPDFADQLNMYLSHNAAAQKFCAKSLNLPVPKEMGSQALPGCYRSDGGCAHACMDKYAKKYHLYAY